jgi:hypothetical protein
MDEYPKIGVKNVAVVNVCLRMEDKLFNQGRIILDIDTYDFAGRITDEVIVGIYNNGMYDIYYYNIQYNFDNSPQMDLYDGEFGEGELNFEYEEYEIQMQVQFTKNKLPDDFTGQMLSFNNAQITIAFDGFEPDMQIIQRCLEENTDLIEQRI